MDLSSFKVPYHSRAAISRIADDFRSIYCADRLPIPVEEVVEFDLRLEIRPIRGMKRETNTDALLLSSFQTIVVDNDAYMLPAHQNRFRFSLAHEVGHLVLHKSILSQVNIESVEDWHAFVEAIPEEEYVWLEWQANEFAGRPLVPRDPLEHFFNEAVSKYRDYIESKGLEADYLQGDVALEYIASSICRNFDVSHDVVQKRLRYEGLWEK